MVQFINSIHQLMVDLERDDRGPEASPPTTEPCNGPCRGLSANAAWSSHCANCPFREE